MELQNDTVCITKDEIEWTNTELKNSLRSIEWDLEDLEDTIDILLHKFKNHIIKHNFILQVICLKIS